MKYPVNIIFYLFVLCSGAFLASLLCAIAGRLSGKKNKPFRLTVTLGILTCLVMLGALFFLFVPLTEIKNVLQFQIKLRIISAAVYFVLGLFFGFFPQTVFPVCFGLYAAFCILTGIISYAAYPRYESLPLKVSQKEIVIDADVYEPVAENAGTNIVIRCLRPKEYLILPLPQLWYRVEEISGCKCIQKKQTDEYWYNSSWCTQILNFVYGIENPFLEVEIKERTFEPVMYNLKFRAANDNLFVKLEEAW